MCVCSAHKHVLPYRSKASFLTAIDVRGTILCSVQHSHLRSSRWSLSYYSSLKTRSPCRRVLPSQTLCLLLISGMMALTSPARLDASLLQTLSDHVMFQTFLQSHISQLSSLRVSSSSFFNVHDSSPYRRVLQMTVFIILFFRQRLKVFVSSSFLLVNAFFARAILDLFHSIRPV